MPLIGVLTFLIGIAFPAGVALAQSTPCGVVTFTMTRDKEIPLPANGNAVQDSRPTDQEIIKHFDSSFRELQNDLGICLRQSSSVDLRIREVYKDDGKLLIRYGFARSGIFNTLNTWRLAMDKPPYLISELAWALDPDQRAKVFMEPRGFALAPKLIDRVEDVPDIFRAILEPMSDHDKLSLFDYAWRSGNFSTVYLTFNGIPQYDLLKSSNLNLMEHLASTPLAKTSTEYMASIFNALASLEELKNFAWFIQNGSLVNQVDVFYQNCVRDEKTLGQFIYKSKIIALCHHASEVYRERMPDSTLIHEFGHALQAGLPPEISDQFTALSWRKDSFLIFSFGETRVGPREEFASDYATTSSKEDFAESFEVYVLRPKELYRTIPKKYYFFKDLEGCLGESNLASCMNPSANF